jgi:hypothetical protein
MTESCLLWCAQHYLTKRIPMISIYLRCTSCHSMHCMTLREHWQYIPRHFAISEHWNLASFMFCLDTIVDQKLGDDPQCEELIIYGGLWFHCLDLFGPLLPVLLCCLNQLPKLVQIILAFYRFCHIHYSRITKSDNLQLISKCVKLLWHLQQPRTSPLLCSRHHWLIKTFQDKI